MFNKRHVNHLLKLELAYRDAHKKFISYNDGIKEMCDHPLIFEHSTGYEDTLGNYSRSGTDMWDCACCGKRLGAVTGIDNKRPGSVRQGRKDIRQEVLAKAPQVEVDVRKHLLSKRA